LSLSSTLVSDAGLKYLTGLTNLKKLYLFDTHVTAAGVQRLQVALPECTIHY
jgi:hypothetical protein